MDGAATTPRADRLTPAEHLAWRGLLRAHTSLVRALDAELEAQHGLSLTSYEVLIALDGAERCRMRMHDVADSVLLSRSGLTRLVDRLERETLVSRQTCQDDARGAFACLTDAGRAKLAEARVTHLAAVRRLFLERFSEAELETMGDWWERVLPGSASCCGNKT